MNWRRCTRLSYSETREFSQHRSIVGMVLIAIVCLVAGMVSVYVRGQLKACVATIESTFDRAQVKEGDEGCQGATVSVGQLLRKFSFTYVVAQQLDQCRDETLQCSIQNRGATINLLSFAAPQFVWGYNISCTRPETCCPEELKTSTKASTACFCEQKLMLRIQEFSIGCAGSVLLNASRSAAVSNYSTLNATLSDVTQRTCPDGEPITVLRFDDASYSAFNSSALCSGTAPAAATNIAGTHAFFTDNEIAKAVDQIRTSVDNAIVSDLQGLKVDSNYVCYSCSPTHDVSQLLMDLVVAISAIGSVACSLVLWLLKATQSEEPAPLSKINSLRL